MVDTNYDHTPAYPIPGILEGRKYVCGPCGETIGNTLGMVKAEDVVAAKVALDETRARLAALQKHVNTLAAGVTEATAGVLELPVFDVPQSVLGAVEEQKAVTVEKEVKNGEEGRVKAKGNTQKRKA